MCWLGCCFKLDLPIAEPKINLSKFSDNRGKNARFDQDKHYKPYGSSENRTHDLSLAGWLLYHWAINKWITCTRMWLTKFPTFLLNVFLIFSPPLTECLSPLVKAMLVLFLLVIPLCILIGYLVFRHRANLRDRWGKYRQSRRDEGDTKTTTTTTQ